jgi:hypothetical protein
MAFMQFYLHSGSNAFKKLIKFACCRFARPDSRNEVLMATLGLRREKRVAIRTHIVRPSDIYGESVAIILVIIRAFLHFASGN